MTSSAREVLKWLAVILMTGDHVAKVIYGGYVPVLSEAGRVAFPLFALVMAYNLAQPGADVGKSVRRLGMWGVVAQPVHALVFGYWLPLNILLTFAAAASCIWAYASRKWALAVALFFVAPLVVDYQWAGVWLVVEGWFWFANCGSGRPVRSMLGTWDPMARAFPYWLWCCMGLLCWYNGNAWALLAIPVMLGLSCVAWPVPRGRWVFYGYYVGHLACLGLIVLILRP